MQLIMLQDRDCGDLLHEVSLGMVHFAAFGRVLADSAVPLPQMCDDLAVAGVRALCTRSWSPIDGGPEQLVTRVQQVADQTHIDATVVRPPKQRSQISGRARAEGARASLTQHPTRTSRLSTSGRAS